MANKAHRDADQKEAEWDQDRSKITFKSTALSVVWGNDNRYWRLVKKNEEPTVLELVQVCWLEVTGSTTVEAGKKYQVSFTVSLKPDAFGWNGCPVFMMAKVGRKGKYSWKKIKALEKADFGSNSIQIPDHDGNKLVIEVEPTAEDRQLYFGLYEVWSGKWKGGLEIHNAIVRIVS
ncbi:protein PHLOEM PROTEIN 2-LIKE A9 [Tripterygium wilfordii]|uniref:protein PHLOEM PROTEIN 2-LIKE A9 n=1 Tax=Tripterygium wilfordii TaxID=458696 RepID=UPI0018F835DF|nr:protein PHLOEM PROTEIN 2-LIKE A9 [Tripterygium wilfordii]